MALTASATLAVTPDGNWNPDPDAGHEGWNKTSGDKTWVPDESYYRRVMLTLTGDAGEYINIVNWEIYDGTTVPFVDNASTVTVQATGGDYTGATAPSLVNNRATRTVWARNATAQDGGTPYYEETGAAWVSTLRATGPRTVLEFPTYLKWDTAGTNSTTWEVEAFLPGAFGVPSATTTIQISNPDIALLGGTTGGVQPRTGLAAPAMASVEEDAPVVEEVEPVVEEDAPVVEEVEPEPLPEITEDPVVEEKVSRSKRKRRAKNSGDE